jgi:hypothetical protein
MGQVKFDCSPSRVDLIVGGLACLGRHKTEPGSRQDRRWVLGRAGRRAGEQANRRAGGKTKEMANKIHQERTKQSKKKEIASQRKRKK